MHKKGLNTSYTWKNEYGLPYESKWSRLAKFCFLNGLSWTSQSKNIILQNFECIRDLRNYQISLPNEHETNIYKLQTKLYADRMCPECMKYGYHSVFHEIVNVNCCFIHKNKLIDIPKEKFSASQYGTYEFVKVKVEDIVNNNELAYKIDRFTHQKKQSKLITNGFILFNSSYIKPNNIHTSIGEVFQRFVLCNENADLSYCKCIYTISSQNIEIENKHLFDIFMQQYIKNFITYKPNFLAIHNINYEDAVTYYSDNFIQNNPYCKYMLEDSLGWSVMSIISDAISNHFNDFNDWCDAIGHLNDFYKDYPENQKNANKLAIILAYEAITGTIYPDRFIKVDSKHWTKFCISKSKLTLPVKEELDYFHKTHHFIKGSITKASQYIVYPIVKDLFLYLSEQVYSLYENKIIEFTHESISQLTNDIWKIPQYAIFYYQDKVDIYRCEL